MSNSTSGTTVLGHPAGLRTLFFTEMWERMSYYGMRAMLVLFMVDSIERGGLGLDDATATAIYGLYTAAVYMVALPGGWVADRLLGAQRAVWYGGLIIMLGHIVLAIPHPIGFFPGLLLVVLGTGLLKPNISAIVGELYPAGDARRDGGFTLFYMGINLGAALGPLVCSTLGESEQFGWHYGFGAAAIGMALGLLQFRLRQASLGSAGQHPSAQPAASQRRSWQLLLGGVVMVVMITAALLLGKVALNPIALASVTTGLIATLFFLFFIYVFVAGKLTAVEQRKTLLILVLCLASAMFWSGFEQAGSSFNLFAERLTDRQWGTFEIPTGWFQSLNPVFILLLAPFFSWLWVALAARHLNPSSSIKFAIGLAIMSGGFLVMYFAARQLASSPQVAASWLISTYLLHTMGELCLSPVGLSAVSKLAPRKFVGQMMGIWFLASALGNIVAGLIAGEFDSNQVPQMPALYWQIAMTGLGAGVVLLVFKRTLSRWESQQ